MIPLIAAGALSAIGGMFGAKGASSSAKRNIRFQREMAQNKYQYMMSDIKQTGLNPILTAQNEAPEIGGAGKGQIPYMNPINKAVTTNTNIYRQQKKGQEIDAQVRNISSQVWQRAVQNHEILANIGLKGQELAIKQIEVRIAETREKIAGVELGIEQQKKLRWELVGDIVSDLTHAYSTVMGDKTEAPGAGIDAASKEIGDSILKFFGLGNANIGPTKRPIMREFKGEGIPYKIKPKEYIDSWRRR